MKKEVMIGTRLELNFLGINKETKIIIEDNCPYLCEKINTGKAKIIRIFLDIPSSLFFKIPIITRLKAIDTPCLKALFASSISGQEKLIPIM